MATQPRPRTDRGYEPAGRYVHSSAVVGERLFVWAGYQDDAHAPMAVHDSTEKRAFLSRVEVFHLQSGTWEQQLTREKPPLGAIGYACAAVEDDLYFFGGWCGHGECKHNSLYNLSTATFRWKMLAPTTFRGTGPMRKSHCQMMAFKEGDVDILFVVGGSGGEPTFRQPGATYENDMFGTTTNEQHLFFLDTTGHWVSPSVTGQPPRPCSRFTVTSLSGNRAVMFGGSKGWEFSNQMLIVKLVGESVHWSRICKPTDRLPNWPDRRRSHAAAAIHGSVLVIVGGWECMHTRTFTECWICDTTSVDWKMIHLPEYITERVFHSLSVFHIGPQCVWLIAFGGQRQVTDTALACTAIFELVQGEDCQWSIGSVLVDLPLISTMEYSSKLLEARRKGVGPALQDVNQQLRHQIQGLQDQVQLLQEDKQQTQQRLLETEQTLQRVLIQSKQRTRELRQENSQLQQDLTQERDAVQQLHAELDIARRDLQQQQQDLQRYTARVQGQAVNEEEHRHWVISRDEVMITDHVLGRGGWGEVRMAKFRGLKVAVKYLHQAILSQYNLRQFMREMNIAAKLRHPNLLLFIGATMDREPMILTELMPTSLRRELEKGPISRNDVATISRDVACGLNYQHQWKPSPIIHRDASSANVLLQRLSNSWQAKVSDYGSANYINQISNTVGPGSPLYAAPEARYPRLHSPKMDVFSFGVLLVEMCAGEQPETVQELQETQISRINWPVMVSIIRECINERPENRPNMSHIMELLPSN